MGDDIGRIIQDYGMSTVALIGTTYAVWHIGKACVERIVDIIKGRGQDRRARTEPTPPPVQKLRSMEPYDRPSLKTHYFFTTCNQLIAEEIDNIDCGCEARTMLFQDMCRIKVFYWRDFMSSIVDAENEWHAAHSGKSLDGYNLGRDVMAAYQRWRSDVENEWRRSGIPEVAIQAFNEWAKPRLNSLRDSTNIIASSPFYDDTTQRLACIMAIHEIALRLIVIDMNTVIYALNGRLDDQIYRNTRIMAIRDLILAKVDAAKARHDAEDRFRLKTNLSTHTPLPGSLDHKPEH